MNGFSEAFAGVPYHRAADNRRRVSDTSATGVSDAARAVKRGDGSRPPFEPPARRAPVEVTLGGAAPFPPRRCGVMPERRTAVVTARVSATEFADWRAKAAAAGLPLSALIRRAMARTRTWTARAAEVERERTREVSRIGNNLNQIARWANTHKGAAEAVEVIARLVAIERALGALVRFESLDRDAH